MNDLMSAEEFTQLLRQRLSVMCLSDHDDAIEAYAAVLAAKDEIARESLAALARVAELEAEVERVKDGWRESLDERDALTAGLSELRAALSQAVDQMIWMTGAFDTEEKSKAWQAHGRGELDRLRAIASQPQGEHGKALLAVMEEVRRVTVGGPPDGCGLCLRGTCRAPAHNALTARLAAIDGAQPGA